MQQPASRAELAVPLIQFLGLIKRRLDLVKLLRAGIEGVGLVIHLVWDEPPIVPGTGWGWEPVVDAGNLGPFRSRYGNIRERDFSSSSCSLPCPSAPRYEITEFLYNGCLC